MRPRHDRIRAGSGRLIGLVAGCLLSLPLHAGPAGAPIDPPSGANDDDAGESGLIGSSGVKLTQKLGENVPMNLEFVDDQGRPVTIGDYFNNDRPVILTLNYYRCPQLCGLTLNALVKGLSELDWTIGEDFNIVTASINPEEGPKLAQANKNGYLAQYERDAAADGWHFLVGEQDSITKLTDAVGFGYRYDEQSGEYAHSSTIIFITPDGRISRYIDDLTFEPKTLRTALIEAGEGTIGSRFERFLITCFLRYDLSSNSYAPVAMNIMMAGGALTMLVVGAGLAFAWRFELLQASQATAGDSNEEAAS